MVTKREPGVVRAGGHVVDSIRASILAAISAPGGVSAADLAARVSLSRDQINRHIQGIRRAANGQLDVQVRHLRGFGYWMFATADEADRWLSDHKSISAARHLERRRLANAVAEEVKRARKAATRKLLADDLARIEAEAAERRKLMPAPVIIAPMPAPKVTITPAGVKVTRQTAPKVDCRSGVDPASDFVGAGFRAAGLGRYTEPAGSCSAGGVR
jgi:biotin operon repressor